MNRSLRAFASALIVLLALAACSVAPAPPTEPLVAQAAALFVPTTFSDAASTDCSQIDTNDDEITLREAICRANGFGPGDAVDIWLDAGTYTLDFTDSGGMVVDSAAAVYIRGEGAGTTVIDAGGTDRIFRVQVGSRATISDVTIQGGAFVTGSGAAISNSGALTIRDSVLLANKGSQAGGAIFSDGDLTVERTTFTGNESNNGGAIYQAGSGAGIVRQSTMNGNRATADDGGAFFVTGTSTMTIENSTMSDNHSAKDGGALVTGSGSSAVVTIYNSTVANNTSATGAALSRYGGSITVKSSIVANSDGNCSGVTNGDFNLEFGTACGFGVSADPLLGPLQDNGGPTWTHAIPEGSPAVDAGHANGLGLDQRGLARTVDVTTASASGGDETDIGAFELQFTTCSSIGDGDWDAEGTWDCGVVPTETKNAIISHKVNLTKSEKVRSIEVKTGGTLQKGALETDAHVLEIKKNLKLDGQLVPRRGTVKFSGTEKQVIDGAADTKRFYKLEIDKTETSELKEVEALTSVTVEKELRLVRGQLKTDDTDLNDLVIESEAKLVSKELKTHRVRGDWTQDGTFETSTSTVEFAGTRKQHIRGASTALAFHNLRVNKTGSEIEAKRLETSKRIRVREHLDVESGQFEPATESQFRHVSIRKDSTLRPRLTASGAPNELEVTGDVRKERLARFERNGSRLLLRGTTRQEVELYSPTELEIDPSSAHSVRFRKEYSENTLAESPVTLVNSLSTLSAFMSLLHGNLVTMSNGSVILDVVDGPVETTVGNVTITVPAGSVVTISEPVEGVVSVEHTSGTDPVVVETATGITELGAGDTTDTVIIQASADPVSVHVDTTVTVGFDGTPIPTGYTATLDWGDTTTTSGTFDSVAGEFRFTHAYVEPGVYSLTATLTDETDEAIVKTHEFLVVYDPDGGFVTGGGWIESPPTACKDTNVCIDTTGKANFGFVSKYKRGASVPSGVTQFQFRAGDLNFHSEVQEWLVINKNASTAQYKGSGTVNGRPDANGQPYKFMLWATDGSPDTFRIRIWSEDAFAVENDVYDNGDQRAIGGGSIKVHSK